MPIDPDFNQYDFEIETDNQKYSKKLVKDIQNCWSARKRKEIDIVEKVPKFKGQIYAIRFINTEHSPPTVSSYTDTLLQYGWGYFTYDEDSLYVGRIIPSTDANKEYVFEGRENVQFGIPAIRQFDNDDLNFDKNRYRDQDQNMSLINDILTLWPEDTIKCIDNVTQNKVSNSYTLSLADYNQNQKNSDIPVCDNAPLGKHVDVLLHSGWGVRAIMPNRLDIAELQILIDDHNLEHRYKFDATENSEKSIPAYSPKKCRICYEHESYDYLVTDTEGFDDDMPVYTPACLDCMKNTEYPTGEEFRNNDSVNIPN